MASREYSKRLGVISDEQLQAALDRFGIGRLLSAEPAVGGLFGQNILLTTTEGEFVFRSAPHWDPGGHDDWQFQKERLFSQLVHESGTGPPVPWPYLLEQSRDIFGWHWAIVPRLPGRAIFQPQAFAREEQREQAAAMGTALAALHTVTLPEPGAYERRTRSIRPITTGYADYVTQTVRELLRRSVDASRATTPEDVAWVESILATARPALEQPFTPTVIHLDYSSSNVLLDDGEGTWRATGVVDWMTAEAGHPEADLCRTLAQFSFEGWDGEESFMAMYRAVHPASPAFEERFPAFVLWERLLIWQYGQRNRVWFPSDLILRSWVEPYLRKAP
jgi:aminoglycoside phosphotransferase (APT) family kinase protein